jgi:glycosyltransferase involved in cell wall biosynthesis
MPSISVTIITKNEEENIEACLESVKWADEAIVVDDMSQDHTPQICQRYANVKIYQRKMENGYGPQKNYALDNVKGEWVLSIDADERVTPELGEEILKRVGKENFNGYYFKMKYLAFGKWILDHPARNLRLFKMNTGKFTNKMVHEKVVIKGEIGVMKNPILHFSRSYMSIEGYLSNQNRYTSYTANDLYNMGRRITFKTIFLYFVIKPIFVFFRKFILWGYKYGFRGFLLSALGAYDYFLSYAKLWEKQGKKSE